MALDALRPDERVEPARDLPGRLERWSRSTGIAVEVWALPGEPLTGRGAELVHATIRDALDGFALDGSVRCVGVALTVSVRGLRLTLSGDGHGLLPERLSDRLRARHAEFAELGGGLSVNAVPAAGITISATLPGPRVRGARGRGGAGSRC
ncbi:hypothetical protein [Nonomuraea candida]|uniref:hypothetical protein n=1 Tax=Nonomuraea candida TaxID=359159 RepID=UPI0005BB2587|nr:hypothetical protein [Nonomuraea candida]